MSKKDREPGIPLSPLVKELIESTFPPKPEVISDLEQKLAAMVDERLASLARRVDLLYRYTVGDRTGRHTLVPNMHQRGDEFPEPER